MWRDVNGKLTVFSLTFCSFSLTDQNIWSTRSGRRTLNTPTSGPKFCYRHKHTTCSRPHLCDSALKTQENMTARKAERGGERRWVILVLSQGLRSFWNSRWSRKKEQSSNSSKYPEPVHIINSKMFGCGEKQQLYRRLPTSRAAQEAERLQGPAMKAKMFNLEKSMNLKVVQLPKLSMY